MNFNQFDPKIDLYDESLNSYMIYWDDLRSSGKEDLTNIYVQSVTVDANSIMLGDINFDGVINVIDIVSLVNGILGGNLSTDQALAGDLNGDGTNNVIDIVSLDNILYPFNLSLEFRIGTPLIRSCMLYIPQVRRVLCTFRAHALLTF